MKAESEKRPLQKRQYIFWVGLAVSGLCFYLIFSNIKWGEFLATLIATDWLFLILGVFFFGVNFLVRALRWQSLLFPTHKISVWDSFAYLMIGYLANLFLPLRVGELFRVMLLGKEKGISLGATLATVAIEKLLDVVSLLVFIVVLPLAMDIPADLKDGILVIEIMAMVMLIALVIFSFQRRGFTWVERLIPGFVPDAITFRVLELLHSFVDGLSALQNWKQFLLAVFYSVGDWIAVAISTHFFMLAVGLLLTWDATLFVLVMVNLGGAVVSAPGGFGVFHFLAIVALGTYSVSRGTAFAFSVLWHETLVVGQTAIGLACLWAKGLSFRQIRRPTDVHTIDAL